MAARTRLFTPQGSRPPVPLERFSGRRRTWIFDVTPDSPYGRRCHVDNWESADARAYVPYAWIGCTELEVVAAPYTEID